MPSARCPDVMTKDSGRQRLSALRWSLLVNPPRERPSPSPPAPLPPTGRAGFATCFALMFCRFGPLARAPAVGRSGHRPRADGLARWWSPPRCPSRSRPRRRQRLDLLQQTLPRAVGRPQPVAFIDRLPGTEPLGQISPLHPGAHPVQDPVDHLPMISPPATTSIALWQERPQPFPLRIRQITPNHAQDNDPNMNQSHDHSGSIRPVLRCSGMRAAATSRHPASS